MIATDEQIERIAEVLARWNPLGGGASAIPDLDGYSTEAADIAFALGLVREKNLARLTRDVLNQAFGLDLSTDDCLAAASQIQAILGRKPESTTGRQ